MLMKLRTIQFSSSRRSRPRMNVGIRAGTTVTEIRATPIRAKLLVKASGWNSLPSRPLSVNTGMNEISMISTEKKIGRPTVRQARMTISRVSPVTFLSPNCSLRWCVAFSTMTMAWSTRMPMEIVMPASDMMLAWMSMMPGARSSHISRNENSTASGSVTQMTNTLRTCQRIRNTATAAMIISCHMTRSACGSPP